MKTTKITPFLLGTLCASASSIEPAAFDSGGKLTHLIHQGESVPIRAGWHAFFEGDLDVSLQPHDQTSPISRNYLDMKWTGTANFPNGRTIDFEIEWNPTESATSFQSTLHHTPPGWHLLIVDSVDFVIDLPRERFAGGTLEPGSQTLPGIKPHNPALLDAETDQIRLVDAEGNWTFTFTLPEARQVILSDEWLVDGWGRDERFFRIRIPVETGLWEDGVEHSLAGSLSISGTPAPKPVALTIDPEAIRYAFDGYGGNFCWGWSDGTEITDFMIETLDMAWSRSELKLIPWDLERPYPGEELREDFERIQRIQDMGIPWIISGWRVPERFYEDPNRRLPGTFRRQLNPAMWPELLDLIGSYLMYLKDNYGAEPDMISFNEPDLGVYVAFTAEGLRDATKKIGAHMEKLGLKTKILLGETANPRDQHQYLLPTIRDPEAMQYVQAISFHSWFGATPDQYRKWAELSRWIDKPILIGEAGFDPGSYRNRNYDSFQNGLAESRENMRILKYAEPAASLFWQFTDDYALARKDAEGNVIPTGRYWLMKHYTNLTPMHSHAVETSSDQDDVYIAAFRKDGERVVHVLNLGAERDATLSGFASGQWQRVVTTEDNGFADGASLRSSGTDATLSTRLPARSLTTFILSQ